MAVYEKSIFINRPQQEVWDFVSNPANLVQWASGNESAEWTSEGPPGVGSTLLEVGKFFGTQYGRHNRDNSLGPAQRAQSEIGRRAGSVGVHDET